MSTSDVGRPGYCEHGNDIHGRSCGRCDEATIERLEASLAAKDAEIERLNGVVLEEVSAKTRARAERDELATLAGRSIVLATLDTLAGEGPVEEPTHALPAAVLRLVRERDEARADHAQMEREALDTVEWAERAAKRFLEQDDRLRAANSECARLREEGERQTKAYARLAVQLVEARAENHRLRSSSAPSPAAEERVLGIDYSRGDDMHAEATGRVRPDGTVEITKVELREPVPRAPSPKEDAPRCEACGGRGWLGGQEHDSLAVPCPTCGTGRSPSTGGGT